MEEGAEDGRERGERTSNTSFISTWLVTLASLFPVTPVSLFVDINNGQLLSNNYE